jgi:alpha-glucosidase
MPDSLRWWQQSVIYQIVVSSFLDTNGDGVGDLNGVIERLDYIRWFGAGTIWLTPIYPSPMEDLGYDISDFTGIHPQFGSFEDFDRLVSEVHQRGMKILLDWVPNHTSDEHPWFVESRSSRDNPRRDWYVWHDGKTDDNGQRQPPNNWISVFGGSAWQWDEPTQQFYYHSFLESQPDLNWQHGDVRSAMFDTMRFWLGRGVDGFRVDAVPWIIQDDQFRDNPPNPKYSPDKDGPDQQVLPKYTWDQPQVHEITADMRRVLDEFDDRLLAGEMVLPIDKIVTYYGDEQRPELHLPMNLHLEWIEWNTEAVAGVIDQYQKSVPPHAWRTWTISSHDCPRNAARLVGEQTRVAAMLLLTLGGTPTHYYGEEIGMKGVPIPQEQARDPQGRRINRNRDPQRTPMQWDGSPLAGFTSGQPWLPIGDDVPTANVASQSDDPHSLLTLYRRLIALRGEQPVLVSGGLELISRQSPLLSYRRIGDNGQLLIVLNMSAEPQTYELNKPHRVLLSVFLDREGEQVHERVELRGDEGVILSQG